VILLTKMVQAGYVSNSWKILSIKEMVGGSSGVPKRCR
jgi:hypothetical protein